MGSLFFTLLRRLNNITAGRNYLYAVLIEVLPERHIICYYRYIFFSGKIIPIPSLVVVPSIKTVSPSAINSAARFEIFLFR